VQAWTDDVAHRLLHNHLLHLRQVEAELRGAAGEQQQQRRSAQRWAGRNSHR
jgi:hypothetical protein